MALRLRASLAFYTRACYYFSMTKKLSTIAVRFDKNAVTFFSRKDGTKVRLAIGKYTKASKPELVDIKITDYCSFGCSFCYQASTLQGKHAPMENIDFAIAQLAKAKVFEAALGGGDPLEHPDIVEILQKFKAAGIVPNFTTKFPAKVRQFWPEIGHLIGGFAYSAETAAQVRSAAKLMRMIPKEKVNLHYVMGLGDREHFRAYLQAAHEVGYRVTLLGYKTVGRGKDVVPFPYGWWVEEVTSLVDADECPDLSVDTPLADQYDGQMPIEKYAYHTKEGAFSLYLDLLSLTMGASSFEEIPNLVPFTKDWRKIYRKKSFAQDGYTGAR